MKLQRHRWGDLHDSPPQKGLNAQPAWESREPEDATGNWSQFRWSQWKVSFPLWNSREEALCEYSPQSELASTGDIMNSRVNCGTPVPTGAQWIKGFLSQVLGNIEGYIFPVHSRCTVHMKGSEDPTYINVWTISGSNFQTWLNPLCSLWQPSTLG